MASGVGTRIGRLSGRLDVGVAVLGLVVALLLLPLRFLAGEVLLEAVPIVLGVGSGLYLVAVRYGDDVRRERVRDWSDWRLGAPMARTLRGSVLVGLASLVLVAVLEGGRTVPFLALAAAVGGLVLVQILFVRDRTLRPALVVAEVLALAVVVRFAALWTTPGLVGVDAWTHVTTYAGAIRAENSLSAISHVKYYGAPLYHLFTVVAADAFGTSLRTALYLSLGLVLPLSTLLVYHTARFVLPVRWSLLAMALFALGDHVIRWGIHVIPTSLGLVFFLAVFYAVTRLFYVEDRLPTYLLATFFGVAAVLTHQVSVFITLAFLGAGVVAQGLARLSDARSTVGMGERYGGTVDLAGLFAVVGTITLINWSVTPYRSGSFLSTMVSTAREALATSTGFLDLAGAATRPAAQSVVATTPAWVEVVDSLGFLLLLGLFVVGSLTVLRDEWRAQLSLTYVVAVATMLLVVLGLPLFGLNLFLPGRWYAFAYAPMAVVGVVGLRYLCTRLSARTVLVGVLVVAIALPGAMSVAHEATPENQVFDDSYPRYAYSDAELSAVETIADRHPAGGPPVTTDHPYRTVFERWQGVSVDALELQEDGTMAADAVVYRAYQSDGAAQVRAGEGWATVHAEPERVCGPDHAVLYANEEVRYCRSPGA